MWRRTALPRHVQAQVASGALHHALQVRLAQIRFDERHHSAALSALRKVFGHDRIFVVAHGVREGLEVLRHRPVHLRDHRHHLQENLARLRNVVLHDLLPCLLPF